MLSMPRRALIAIVVTGFAHGAQPAAAQSMPFTFEQGVGGFVGFDDTTLFSESENSGGGTPAIFSGTINNLTFEGDTQSRRALIRIDLSAIPAGWTIDSVSLQLAVEMSGANFGDIDHALHRVREPWGEGMVVGASAGGFGGPADDGDATWVSNQHGQTAWTSPGGYFTTQPSANVAVGTAGTTATWTGSGLVSDVQRWVNFPGTNRGWIVISDLEGTRQRVKRFYSSEAATFRPVLTVMATPGPPLGLLDSHGASLLLALVLGGLCVRQLRRVRSRA